MAPQPALAPLPAKMNVAVDTAEFIRTRDALTTAYIHLSYSMDRMVKAYVDHTQEVLKGSEVLNLNLLLTPFNEHLVAGAQAVPVLQPGTSLTVAPAAVDAKDSLEVIDGEGKKRKKREYKRDPNAPKRPLTAYFRYLQENRAAIAAEILAHPEKFEQQSGKPGDLSKIATERWNALTADQQEPYRAAYRDALQTYEKASEAYKASTADGTVVVPEAVKATPSASSARKSGASKSAKKAAGGTAATPGDDASDNDQTSQAKKTAAPSSTTKRTPKKTAAAAAPAAAKPVFSSIPAETAATSKSASPERKRKAPAETEEDGKKKRARKTKTAAEAATPAATATAVIPASSPAVDDGGKKKRKDKKRKSTGA